MADSAADTIRHAAGLARCDGQAWMARLADWLEFEAQRLDETAGDPDADESRGMFALDLAHAYLGEVTA